MAIEIGGVRIAMGINAGEFRRGSRQVGREMESLGTKISRISDQINRASIFINTGIMAAQRFAGAAAGIFRVASAFEKGMSNVATLIDESTESLKDMSEEVLKIAQRSPVAINELTEALYDIRSAGIPAADSMRVLERSAQLAVAGLGTTKQAVDLVTSSINAFGLEGRDAESVFDIIFKTVKNGKTTISQLAQGFGAVAGTVATAGIELDDYLASVAALTTTGLPAAQAHTQIRAAIAGLLRETKETKALFDALNVGTFKELVKQSGSITVAFQRIVNATRGNDAQLIKLLGSVEAYNALIGLSGKQNQAYLDTLDSMRDGSNAVDEAFEKQNRTIEATTQRLRNNIETMVTAIGSRLAPTLNSVSETVANMAKAFTELDPATQEFIAQAIAIAGVVIPATIAIGFFVNALASLIPVFAAVGAAIAAVAAIIVGLIASTGPIGAFVIVASAVVTAWNIFKEDILAIWETVAGFISRKIDAIVERLTRFANAVQQAFGLLADFKFSEAFATLEAAVTRTNEWTTAMEYLGNRTEETFTRKMPAAATAFNDGFVMPVTEGVNKLNEAFTRWESEALRGAERTIKEIQTPTEALIAQQQRLKDQLDAGGLSARQYGIAMQRAAYIAQNAYAGMASDIVGSLQNVFGQSKAFAIAQAIINTYEGVTKALAAYPPPFNFAAAAAVLASGLAQVQQIRSTNKGSGGRGGGGGGGAGAGAVGAAQAPQRLIVQGLDPNALISGASAKQLAETLLEYQRDGGQVVLR